MNDIFQTLGRLGIIPVIKLENPETAVQLGRALIDGKLPVAEVTFRTASAAESIKRLRKELPDLLVGAGTVLTLAQAEAAVEAGAHFAVTPGFNPRIVEYFIGKGIPVIPGINSPTQVEMGLERGLQLLKFFPAEVSGGTRMLKALYGPYTEVQFVPTGGIDSGNLADYLRLPNVVACGGSWMVKEESIKQGRFTDIAAACMMAVELAAACRNKI
ncbi:MAG: 2-dehydro-3-deoxyphosphogluconate aldolase [Spirochaetes bacterium RIFOXYC1_FULL_54_7]|nr:MAG: 2-dehydro-3-deoxyphosphogluconate aldolase [Spirochaetes bacterium RIFOXYC1_FULL_54_7]